MLATVRTVGETDAFTASLQAALVCAGGFVSFVSPPMNFTRAYRFQAVLPASTHHVDVRRVVLDQEEDYRDLLTDNPALLTGLLPQESPRWFTAGCELGSDNYIG